MLPPEASVQGENRDGNTDNNTTWCEKLYNKIFLKTQENGCCPGKLISLFKSLEEAETHQIADLKYILPQ